MELLFSSVLPRIQDNGVLHTTALNDIIAQDPQRSCDAGLIHIRDFIRHPMHVHGTDRAKATELVNS